MYDAFKGPDKRIVVGTTLDPSMDDFLASVATFARKTSMTTRLVHVIEPSRLRSAMLGYPEVYLSEQITEILERSMLSDAKGALNDLAEKFGSGHPCESEVLRGMPADVLIAEATASTASLLSVGLREPSYKGVPRGFSAVLTLVADSPLPVLVLPQRRVNFDKPKLRFLVADDLGEKSRGALSTAIEMAICMGEVELTHLNICPHTEEELGRWLGIVERELSSLAPDWSANLARKTPFQGDAGSIRASLERRVGFAKELLRERGSSYKCDVAFGDVRSKLNEYIEAHDPDIVFFGRHAALHRRPLGIGKLPFHAMLAASRPIIIAPGRHQ